MDKSLTNSHDVTSKDILFSELDEQTPADALRAVKQNGYALEFVKDQTAEICLAAVVNRGLALKWVKHQTPEICFAAIRSNPWAIEYVESPSR